MWRRLAFGYKDIHGGWKQSPLESSSSLMELRVSSPAKALWNIPSGNLASSLERTTTLGSGSIRITELNIIIYFSQYCGPIPDPSFKSITTSSELFGTLRITRIGPVYLHDTNLRLALNIKCPVSISAQEMVGSITIITTAINTIIKIIFSTTIPP